MRAADKERCFEVIAGRSVVAFRRTEADAVPPPKCFGFVQIYLSGMVDRVGLLAALRDSNQTSARLR